MEIATLPSVARNDQKGLQHSPLSGARKNEFKTVKLNFKYPLVSTYLCLPSN